ncbi:MAG: hypothetical protein IPP46_04805 [Bacteroidetes bacterium]|jgi:membrane protein implicated in regulation of membrane protease activity|nr:hypothetical protein [Bacteroidota bacterium]
MNFLSNKYYHLLLAGVALVAGIKIWLQPLPTLKMQYFLTAVILFIIVRSIYRFVKLHRS